MEDVDKNPEKWSPIVSYPGDGTGEGMDLVGRKIEARWKTDSIVCLEGTILEIIPYTANRASYRGIGRVGQLTVALVKWDDIFDYKDSYVPLNENKYAKEGVHCGWNILSEGYLEQQRLEEAINQVSRTEDYAAMIKGVYESDKQPEK